MARGRISVIGCCASPPRYVRSGLISEILKRLASYIVQRIRRVVIDVRLAVKYAKSVRSHCVVHVYSPWNAVRLYRRDLGMITG